VVFVGLFIALVWSASYPPSGAVPEDMFMRSSPLAAATAASQSNIWLYLLPAWILLGLTMVSGRFFCGWICPLGSVLEWLPSLGNRRRKKLSTMRPKDLSGEPIGKVDRRIRFKYVFLIILLLLLIAGINIIWIFDPLVIANRTVLFVFLGTIPGLFIALVVLAVIVGPRFWCQEMCPLGAAYSAVSMVGSRLPASASPLALVKDAEACTHCGDCAKACPFEIVEVADSKKTGRLAMADCALCGECVGACPCSGALSLQTMGVQVLGSGKGKDSSCETEEALA
jgi:ferredoxin-type protein NapH